MQNHCNYQCYDSIIESLISNNCAYNMQVFKLKLYDKTLYSKSKRNAEEVYAYISSPHVKPLYGKIVYGNYTIELKGA